MYVGNAWSPSSAALAVRYFEAKDDGLVLGTPRDVRADEWAVLTPFTQATVNSGFARYNSTSYYHEDLRMMFALPLHDWGLVFKPTMLGYSVLPPAFAFSLHHYLIAALFVIGYLRLFERCGARSGDAFGLSLCVFFSAYTQTWWTAIGPLVAFFPWMFIALDDALSRGSFLDYLVYYWLAVCWILSFFYPPLIIALAFVGAALMVGLRRPLPSWRQRTHVAAVTLFAILTAAYYLQDYLRETWSTIYPGRRLAHGGTVGLDIWISQFFPTMHLDSSLNPLISDNICAIASSGSYYLTAALLFLDYPTLRNRLAEQPQIFRAHAFLVTALLMMWAWMLIDLPGWLGAPLLWNRIPPERMEFAAGLLFLVLVYRTSQIAGFRITSFRAFCGSAIGIFVWVAAKHPHELRALSTTWLDFLLIPLVWGIWLFGRNRPDDGLRGNTAAIAGAAAVSALSFGLYNPLQSAIPIFDRERTAVTAELDRIIAVQNPAERALAVPGFFGAVLNGWGYPSVAHVLATPKMDVWKRLFPGLEAEQREDLFNRFAHVAVSDTEIEPRLIRFDAVVIPRTPWDSTQAFFPRKTSMTPDFPWKSVDGPKGYVDQIQAREGSSEFALRLFGWAAFAGWNSAQTLFVLADPAPESIRYVDTIRRFDVAQAMGSDFRFSGFSVELRWPRGAVRTDDVRLCLLSQDGEDVHLLRMAPDKEPTPDCQRLWFARR